MEPRVFASLVLDDQIPKVVSGIERAVASSFAQEQQPGRIILVTGARGAAPKREEVKRRAEMCLKIFRSLRGDLSWTVDRILDHLPQYLRKELDGVPWEPEARRATWAAGQ